MLAELEPLATSTGAYAFVVLLGLLWGSFANVCIYRWPPSPEFPKGRSVVLPASHCFACKTPIKWYDNTPLVAWLWLRGKCRACKAPFSPRYLIVEAAMGALFGVAWWMTVDAGALFEPLDARLIRFAIYAAFCFVMVVITFIDIDHKLILDKLTIPSTIVFYGLSLLVGHTWWSGLVGIAIGYGVPWVIGEIYFITAEREGLGLGDSMLLALVGALLGWRGVVASLFLGALVGSIVGVLVLMRGEPAAEGEPPASRASGLVALGAVGSTVLAAIAGLRGMYILAGVGCVAALVFLVISRRLEPALPDAELPPDVTDEPAPPTRTPALLAMSAGLLLVGAVGAVMIRLPIVSGGLAAAGLAVLFGARYLFQRAGASEPEPVEPPADAPSVMRTELPFGPFLALGAVFYLFAEPWIVLQFSLV